MYKQSTQVPNVFFDKHLSRLTEAEMKVLLIITRQTNGWINKHTGKRKERDRITNKWFRRTTGMSKRAISKALNTLSFKKLILITDYRNNQLPEGKMRKGKDLYYSLSKEDSSQNIPSVVRQTSRNETNALQTNIRQLTMKKFQHVSKFL